jgi:putative DNA primase/helicase
MTDLDEPERHADEQSGGHSPCLKVVEGGGLRQPKRRGGKAESAEQDEPAKKSQAQVLVELASDVPLFLTADDEPYADIHVAGNRETVRLSNRAFKLWLRGKFYELTGGAPTPAAMQSAIETLAAKAWNERRRNNVFVRIGGQDGAIYIDLANGSAAAAEVNEDG